MGRILLCFVAAFSLTAGLPAVAAARGEIIVCDDPDARALVVFRGDARGPGGPKALVEGVLHGSRTAAAHGALNFLDEYVEGALLRAELVEPICSDDGLLGARVFLLDRAGDRHVAEILAAEGEPLDDGRNPATLTLLGSQAPEMDGAILVVSALDGPMP